MEKVSIEKDKQNIDQLTTHFFNLFNNLHGTVPNLDLIKQLFINEGIIVNSTEEPPLVYDLDSFIAPRKDLLINGPLTDFSEQETACETEIFGNIAQRWSKYEKSGKMHGEQFDVQGTKSFQFIKVNRQWKISSVIWCDQK